MYLLSDIEKPFKNAKVKNGTLISFILEKKCDFNVPRVLLPHLQKKSQRISADKH